MTACQPVNIIAFRYIDTIFAPSTQYLQHSIYTDLCLRVRGVDGDGGVEDGAVHTGLPHTGAVQQVAVVSLGSSS